MMRLPSYIDKNFKVLLPIKPYTGESWRSFFWRTAYNNYPDAPHILAVIARTKLEGLSITDKGDIFMPTEQRVIEILAYLTFLTPLQLLALTEHSLLNDFQYSRASKKLMTFWNKSEYEVTTNIQNLYRLNRYQFCIPCLIERREQKVIFTSPLVAFCVKHKCLLTDVCPSCRTKLNSSKVFQGRCSACKKSFELEEAYHISQGLEVSAQIYIQDHLTNIHQRESINSIKSLSKIQTYLYFSNFYTVLDDVVLTKYIQEFTEQKLRALELNRQIKTFIKTAIIYNTLLNWPNNFYEFIEFYLLSTKNNLKQDYLLWEDNSRLYRFFIKLAGIEEMENICKFIDDYLLKKYSSFNSIRQTSWSNKRPLFTSQLPMISFNDACKVLRVNKKILNQFVDRDLLTKYSFRDDPQIAFLVSEVEALRQRWSLTYTLAEISNLLDISQDVIRDLIKADVLLALRGPNIDSTPHWRIAKETVEELKETLKNKLLPPPKHTSNSTLVGIRWAANKVASLGENLTYILLAILRNQITGYYIPNSDEFSIHQICFLDTDIASLIRSTKEQRKWLNRYEVAKIMNVKDIVVVRWVKPGLLRIIASHAGAQYFNADEISEFANNHLTSEEVAKELNINVLTVQSWAREGKLNPVAGPHIDGGHRYFFTRKEIEYWRDNTFLSAPELAQLLHLSRAQMSHWIRNGRIKPISGPGIDESGHYLFLLNEEIKKRIKARDELKKRTEASKISKNNSNS